MAEQPGTPAPSGGPATHLISAAAIRLRTRRVTGPIARLRAGARWLTSYPRALDHTGVVLALLAFASSLMPSLLPRPWGLQGLVSGVTFAGGYGLGTAISGLARRLVRRFGTPEPRPDVRRRAWHGVWLLAAIVLPVILWFGSRWQQDIRQAVGEPRGGRVPYLGVLVVALLTWMALLGLARSLRHLYRFLARLLRRRLPLGVARVLAAALVIALVTGIANGVIYRGLLSIADHSFAAADQTPGTTHDRPSSATRSGSPTSLVTWDSLGRYGRLFVTSGPTASQITAQTRRPAVTPIRVYAGLRTAPALAREAQLVLAELRRTHAFDRQVLAVATTTGEGWIDATMPSPLEYMYGGDTAIASMQYSYLPSWISFVTDRARARSAGRELFNTIYAYWSQLPAAHRPRLVVFGESLGAYGSGAAFSSSDDLLARTDGALFAGPPNSTKLWSELTSSRVPGSPERLPLSANSQRIRFAATAAGLRERDGSLAHPSLVYIQHASDPIVWWSPSLIWKKPDWLDEPRGDDLIPQVRWYPFVTFWQISSDLAISLSPPSGHGHHYGPEFATAWAAILQPPNWSDAGTAALSR